MSADMSDYVTSRRGVGFYGGSEKCCGVTDGGTVVLLFNKYFKLNANIYVVCVKGRLQININTQKYAIYPGEMLICMPNMILSNCTTSSDFKGAMY